MAFTSPLDASGEEDGEDANMETEIDDTDHSPNEEDLNNDNNSNDNDLQSPIPILDTPELNVQALYQGIKCMVNNVIVVNDLTEFMSIIREITPPLRPVGCHNCRQSITLAQHTFFIDHLKFYYCIECTYHFLYSTLLRCPKPKPIIRCKCYKLLGSSTFNHLTVHRLILTRQEEEQTDQ